MKMKIYTVSKSVASAPDFRKYPLRPFRDDCVKIKTGYLVKKVVRLPLWI